MKNLINKIQNFNHMRGWDQVKPGNIAKSIIIESAELLEHFQWEDRELDVQKVGSEAADVFMYLVSFCHSLKLDLNKIVSEKLIHNAKKYPIGSNYYHQKQLYRKS